MHAEASITAGFKRAARPWLVCALTALSSWLLPTPDTAAAGGSPGLDRGERSLIRAINRVRTQHGLPRLRSTRALNRSADYHSRDMLRANFFGHASSNGTPMDQRVRRFRPSHRLGENLAYLPRSQRGNRARRVVRMWMDSPGHRAMLLSPSFKRIGVSRRAGAFGKLRAVVYTADFASAR